MSKYPRIDEGFDKADGCLDAVSGAVTSLSCLLIGAIVCVAFFGFVFYLLGLLVKALNWVSRMI
jgi:hypothetical protein